jgi:hypothetical protein
MGDLVTFVKKDNQEETSQIVRIAGADEVKRNIDLIRIERGPAVIKKLKISEEIVSNLANCGTFLIDKNAMNGNNGEALYCHDCGYLYSISKKDNLFSSFLHENYWLNSASTEFSGVIAAMVHKSIQNNKTKVHKQFYYRKEDNTFFIPFSRNNMLKCTQDGIVELVNGTEGVFFKTSDSFSSFDYEKGFDKGKESMIKKTVLHGLRYYANSKIYLDAKEASFLLTILLYFILFSQSMATRPILIVHGPRGSGKSTLLKKLGIALFGPEFRLTLISRSRRDLETEFANNLFCCFDNVDRDLKVSFRDALAAVSTGTGFRARKLRTDSQQLSHSPYPVIAMTTRNPAFSEKDDDILNRALIIRLQSMQNIVPENQILKDVEKFRGPILNEIVSTIPNILKAFEQDAPIAKKTDFRMADFQDFAYKAAFPIFNGIYSEEEIGDFLNNVFAKSVASQHDYLLGNPFFLAVDAFVSSDKKILEDILANDKENKGNIANEYVSKGIPTSDLFKVLTLLDKENSFGFAKVCKSVGSLGKLLANNEAILDFRYGYKYVRGAHNKLFHFFSQPEDGQIVI